MAASSQRRTVRRLMRHPSLLGPGLINIRQNPSPIRGGRESRVARKRAAWSEPPVQLSDFDFPLPEDRIALRPASPRDAARLLVVRPGERLEDRTVIELPALLQPGDA